MKKEKNLAEYIGTGIIGVMFVFSLLFLGALAYQLAKKLISFIF